MTNLVQQFGANYFSGRFAGAFFLTEDNTPAIVRSAGSREVEVALCKGTVEAPRLEPSYVSNSFFKSMSQFDIQNMGWRCAGRGRFLAYMERMVNGYRRGTTRDGLDIGISPITSALIQSDTLDVGNYTREAAVARMVLLPTFTPFSQGVQDIIAGRIISFAVSSSMAVYAQDNENMAIMFGKRKVGSVDFTGKTTFTAPSVEKFIKEAV